MYPACVNFTQYQAGEAERQIKAEFERLHRALVTEELRRLEVLACEEKEKLESINSAIEKANRDTKALQELIDSLKKEMGNEDLALVRVSEGISSKATNTFKIIFCCIFDVQVLH